MTGGTRAFRFEPVPIGIVGAQRTLLKVTNAATRIVPGDGPVMTRADLEAEMQMLATVRDRLVKLLKMGYGPKEMIAAKPTAGVRREVRQSGAVHLSTRTWGCGRTFTSWAGSFNAAFHTPLVQSYTLRVRRCRVWSVAAIPSPHIARCWIITASPATTKKPRPRASPSTPWISRRWARMPLCGSEPSANCAEG